MSDSATELATLRVLTAAARLRRTDAELATLMPNYRMRCEAAEQIARINLGDTPMAVTYDTEWRAPASPTRGDGGSV